MTVRLKKRLLPVFLAATALASAIGFRAHDHGVSLDSSPPESPDSASLHVATNALHLAYIDKPYVAFLKATGGTLPYRWSTTSGPLPGGLALNPKTGQITGTPTQGGTFSITAVASDSSGLTASKVFALQVFEQPTDKYGGLVSKPCPNGRRAHFYVQKIDNRWHLCTPAGHAFWLNGVYAASRDQTIDYQGISNYAVTSAKYATGVSDDPGLNWALSVVRREQSWGFNANVEPGNIYVTPNTVATQWRTSDRTIPIHVPYVCQVSATIYSSFNLNHYAPGPTKNYKGVYKLSVFSGWMAGGADVFDPNFSAWIVGDLRSGGMDYENCLRGPNTDYLIGIVGDESDNTGGFRASKEFRLAANGAYTDIDPDPHWGWMTLVSSPVEAATPASLTPKGRSPTDLVFSDTQFYSKRELAKWLQQTADDGPGYPSIAALNAAWGSNYDTFGTDATSYVHEACAGGNGTGGLYTCTLAHAPVTPLTVQALVGGTLAAGDDGSGPRSRPATGSGDMRGNEGTTPLGSITYSSGALSIAFSRPIPNATPIVVNYQTGGWGSGHGLLDEDGTCPSGRPWHRCWVPKDAYRLSGATPAMKKDLDNFLYHFAKRYASDEKTDFNAAAPGVLYLGPDVLGGWSTPARAPVLKAFGQYTDLFEMPTIPSTNPFGTIKDDQARVDYVAEHAGDRPWFNFQGFWAQADSYMSVYPDPHPMFKTQAERGEYYKAYMKSLLNTSISAGCKCSLAGTYPIVGMSWWEYNDMQGEKANWGLVTLRDNPYDGISSRTGLGYDSWGYPTGCLPAFGCERANYGDFIDPVLSANLDALRAVAH